MSNEADTQEHDRWERLLEPIESRLRGAEQMYMELFREESRRWHKEVGWTRAREPEMRIRLARLVPNLEPLLAGVVQPADFVKRWIESVEKRVPDSQVLFETSPVIEESPLEPEEIRALRKRRAFDLAVAREDLRLRAWLGGIAQRHVYRTAALFVANVLVLLILLILRSSARSAIGSAGELLYVSVLLVFPTISLFVYSQFLHWTHLAEQEGKTYLTETQKDKARVHEIAPELLAAALQLASHRVVVKRPRKAPAIAGQRPSASLKPSSQNSAPSRYEKGRPGS